MSYASIFGSLLDDEDEVSSELAMFNGGLSTAYEASNLKGPTETVERDRYGAQIGKVGISALMKCTFAIRQMAYGAVPDSLDEYLQMGATTARDSLRIFYKTKHEAARKDVKRAFGVLKLKWKLIKYPARGMSRLLDLRI
ncbi:ALP1-like protein [Tanacetum coccineum]